MPGGGSVDALIVAMHPGGTGPTRARLIVPARPALLPPVKLNASCAVVQLVNVTLALPTATVFWPAGAAWSKMPPVVSPSVNAIVRLPGVNVPCPVYQRCPAAPAA